MSIRAIPPAVALLLVATSAGPPPAFAQTRSSERHLAREGWYLDRDGRVARIDAAYAAWSSPERYERQWLRSGLWAGVLLAFGTTWYWVNADLNRLDWDFPALTDRLSFDAVRFDDNRFTTNNLLHPMAGLGYYGLSRVNGLRVLESLAVALVASAVWEYAFEWREKVSINDSVFTPGAGVALGEWLFHLGDYLNSAPGGGGWPQRSAQLTLGFPRYLHTLLDGSPDGPPQPADDLGFGASTWHRFHLAYELQNVRNDRGESDFVHAAVLDSELVSVPGYLRPGHVRLGFANGDFTRLSARLGLSDGGLEEVDLQVHATLAGYLVQDLEPLEGGRLRGHSTMIGFDVGYTYEDRWLLDRRDQRAAVHVAGPRAVSRLALGPAWLELDGRAHVDFSGVRALAFPRWADDNGTVGIKSVVDKRGYYYGLGWSGELAAALRIEGGFLRGEIGYAHTDSVEGLDREQERVTRDVSMDDHQLDYRVGLGFGPPQSPLELRLGHEGLYRWSAMGDVTHHRWDRRWTASFGSTF